MYQFISDNGHGWLRVPLKEIQGLEFSSFSYMDKDYAYLEEDSDATDFMVAKGLAFGNFDEWAEEVLVNGESAIRTYPQLAPIPIKE